MQLELLVFTLTSFSMAGVGLNRGIKTVQTEVFHAKMTKTAFICIKETAHLINLGNGHNLFYFVIPEFNIFCL